MRTHEYAIFQACARVYILLHFKIKEQIAFAQCLDHCANAASHGKRNTKRYSCKADYAHTIIIDYAHFKNF